MHGELITFVLGINCKKQMKNNGKKNPRKIVKEWLRCPTTRKIFRFHTSKKVTLPLKLGIIAKFRL